MPIAIGTTKDENAVVGTTSIQHSVRGEPFDCSVATPVTTLPSLPQKWQRYICSLRQAQDERIGVYFHSNDTRSPDPCSRSQFAETGAEDSGKPLKTGQQALQSGTGSQTPVDTGQQGCSVAMAECCQRLRRGSSASLSPLSSLRPRPPNSSARCPRGCR